MTFNPQKAKDDAERLNNLLKAEPQYALIQNACTRIGIHNAYVAQAQAAINKMQQMLTDSNNCVAEEKEFIQRQLLVLETNTGFGRAPDLAHLMTVVEKYEVTDTDAVPKDYITTKITSSVDKKKLNQAIAEGKVDLKSNWLKIIPGYKTVVLK